MQSLLSLSVSTVNYTFLITSRVMALLYLHPLLPFSIFFTNSPTMAACKTKGRNCTRETNTKVTTSSL